MNHKTRPSWQPLAWDIVAALVVLFAGGLLGWPGMGGPFGPFFGASPGEGFGGFGGFDSGSGPGGPLGPRPHETAALQIASALLLAVPATAMLARRRWPLTVFGVAFVCFAGVTLLHVPGFGAGVAVVIAGYALAYRRSRSTAFGVAVAAAVVIVLLSLMRGDWGTFDLRVLQIAPALLISTALGAGRGDPRVRGAASGKRRATANRARAARHRRPPDLGDQP